MFDAHLHLGDPGWLLRNCYETLDCETLLAKWKGEIQLKSVPSVPLQFLSLWCVFFAPENVAHLVAWFAPIPGWWLVWLPTGPLAAPWPTRRVEFCIYSICWKARHSKATSSILLDVQARTLQHPNLRVPRLWIWDKFSHDLKCTSCIPRR